MELCCVVHILENSPHTAPYMELREKHTSNFVDNTGHATGRFNLIQTAPFSAWPKSGARRCVERRESGRETVREWTYRKCHSDSSEVRKVQLNLAGATADAEFEICARKQRLYINDMDAYSPNLHLGATWKSLINVTPRPLYPRERIPVTIKVKAGWDLQPLCRNTEIRKIYERVHHVTSRY
jgi:hypothetical protein